MTRTKKELMFDVTLFLLTACYLEVCIIRFFENYGTRNFAFGTIWKSTRSSRNLPFTNESMPVNGNRKIFDPLFGRVYKLDGLNLFTRETRFLSPDASWTVFTNRWTHSQHVIFFDSKIDYWSLIELDARYKTKTKHGHWMGWNLLFQLLI